MVKVLSKYDRADLLDWADAGAEEMWPSTIVECIRRYEATVQQLEREKRCVMDLATMLCRLVEVWDYLYT